MPIENADLVAAALRTRGSATLVVRGESMLPTLLPGSTVRIDRVGFDDVVPGQVAATRLGSDVFVHRILARERDALYTAGDNMSLYDPAVTRDRFLGIVAGVVARIPDRVYERPAGSVGPGHVWMLDAAPHDVRSRLEEFGWRVHRRTGPAAEILAEFSERAGDGYRIGVSEYGAYEADVVLAHGVPRGSHIVVGRCFGGHPMLPPEMVDAHIRLSPPGRDLGIAEVSRRLVGMLCHSAGRL